MKSSVYLTEIFKIKIHVVPKPKVKLNVVKLVNIKRSQPSLQTALIVKLVNVEKVKKKNNMEKRKNLHKLQSIISSVLILLVNTT